MTLDVKPAGPDPVGAPQAPDPMPELTPFLANPVVRRRLLTFVFNGVRRGQVSEATARRLARVRPASPADLPGEVWAPIPGWPSFDLSTEGRVRHDLDFAGEGPGGMPPDARRHRILVPRRDPGLDGRSLTLRLAPAPGRAYALADLIELTFGHAARVEYERKAGAMGATAPASADPSGERWRVVPRLEAYEVSSMSRVRCYWIRGSRPPRMAPTPQRLVQRRVGPEARRVQVRLRDERGRIVWASVAQLLWCTFGPRSWSPPPAPRRPIRPWEAPPDAEWRPVPGWEPFYDVSRCGLVRSYHAAGSARWWGPSRVPQRILRPSWDRVREQMVVTLCNGAGRGQRHAIARLVWLAFGGR